MLLMHQEKCKELLHARSEELDVINPLIAGERYIGAFMGKRGSIMFVYL